MHTAPLGRRVLALVIDWIVAALSAGAIAGVAYPPETPVQNLIITAFYVVEVGVLVGLLGFSIGKRVVGIRVENADGRPPGPLVGIARAALVCLVIPPLVQNAEGRGLQDVLTGTRQIKV